MAYVIKVGIGNYLVCYERIGDTHYTFNKTSDRSSAEVFDFKPEALKVLNKYLSENVGETASVEPK